MGRWTKVMNGSTVYLYIQISWIRVQKKPIVPRSRLLRNLIGYNISTSAIG